MKDVYEFTFENQQSITCTDDHKILTKNFDLKEINEVYIENMYVFGKE